MFWFYPLFPQHWTAVLHFFLYWLLSRSGPIGMDREPEAWDKFWSSYMESRIITHHYPSINEFIDLSKQPCHKQDMSKKFIIPPLRCQILFFEGETHRSSRSNKITIPHHACNAAHRSLPALLLTTQLQASAISNSANLRCESLSTFGGFPRKKPKQWW